MERIEFKPTNYPSNLTEAQWELIKEYFPQGPNSGHHKRSLIDAVLYLKDNGCKWRAIPHDYPSWSTVHTFYFRARISGLWDKVLDVLVKKTSQGRTDRISELWHNRLAERQNNICKP